MSAVLPVFRPSIPPVDAVLPYLRQMDRNRVYSNAGPLVRQLEQRYSEFLGVPPGRVVAVSSGTAGITAAVLAIGASEWIVPDWTFAATPLAVLRATKSVSFVDVQKSTGTLPATALAGLSAQVAALPVMPFGSFATATDFIVRDHVVLDAAASLANARGCLSHLAMRSAVVFSLHATKILGCGEGGLVVCGSDDLARDVRSTINFGFEGTRESIHSGFNGKLSEISAAYALASLDRADDELLAWQVQGHRAREASFGLPLQVLSPRDGEIGPYWIMRWQDANSEMPASLGEELSLLGIETRSWWASPCSSMPAFDVDSSLTPNSHWLARNTIGLPFCLDMVPQDFDRVGHAMRQVLERTGDAAD